MMLSVRDTASVFRAALAAKRAFLNCVASTANLRLEALRFSDFSRAACRL